MLIERQVIEHQCNLTLAFIGLHVFLSCDENQLNFYVQANECQLEVLDLL